MCLIIISFTYVAGQMRGVGIVFSQFLNIPINWGVLVGMVVVFITCFGWYEGITHTGCSILYFNFAYMVPAYISRY